MTESLAERDRKRIWHPFTQHGQEEPILPVVRAYGSSLELEDGTRLIDGISSWWVNLHGHSHPRIAQAIAEQARLLDHILFAGFTHEPATRLAEALIALFQDRNLPLTRAFYSDNGSTSVEVALKMAYQLHWNRKDLKRSRFLALRGSYHGDTLGAMAASEPDGYHAPFRKLLPSVDFVPPDDLVALERLLETQGNEYCALIFEPLIQGAAGMRMHSAEYLRQACLRSREHGLLLIADEVFTGFFRTGTCFAIEQVGIDPDLLCLSKGITGGALPLAVTLAREEIFDAFRSSDITRAFLHGHSYTANPIACAAALASLQLLLSPETQARIREICEQTRIEIEALRSHPRVASARHLGTIGAVEVKSWGAYGSMERKRILEASIRRGVLLRPLGPVLYAVPPYCSTQDEITKIYRTLKEVIDAV